MPASLISFDTSELEELADDLAMLDGQTMAEMRRDAVQEMASIVRRKSIAQATGYLNLTQDYVEARIKRDEEVGHSYWKEHLRAEYEGTTLQRFGAGLTQLWKPNNWSNARIAAAGHEFGPWPGWTRRTGDKSRGIPADYKNNGIAVAVKRGQNAKRIATAFTMPLRRANDRVAGGNGIGVFRRDARGDIEHLYGPSVYQTFRSYIAENEQAIADGLRDQFIAGFDRAMQRTSRK